MKPVMVPHVYTRFACKAGACRHTCCVGWEIGIDADTLNKYDTLPGEIGDRIRTSIERDRDGTASFVLTHDERCPHLTQDGLCAIITALGKEALCGICRDHPRFRNHLPDSIELGLGLCCEAACELILGETEPFHTVTLPEPMASRERAIAMAQADEDMLSDGEDALLLSALRELREELLSILTDRTWPLGTRILALADRVGGLILPADAFASWADFLMRLERLDPAWDACLHALHTLEPVDRDAPLLSELTEESSPIYENLIAYFLYRYMTASPDPEAFDAAALRVSFAVAATSLIHAIVRATGTEVSEIARMFSGEVEYSEENRVAFEDSLIFGTE